MPLTEIDDLLNRWEEARRSGTPISADELCRDCPDQLVELRRQIAALQFMDNWLDVPMPATLAPGDSTVTATPAATVQTLTLLEVKGPRYRPIRKHAQGGLG